MKTPLTFIPLLVALSSAAVHADESRLAAQALHCSAVFSVFAETHADDPALKQKFGRAVDIFAEVYAREHGDTDEARRQAVAQRGALLERFRATLAEREPYLREDGVVCGAWAEGFLAQGEQWSYVPVYPKVIGPGVRATYQKIAAEAFGRWQR